MPVAASSRTPGAPLSVTIRAVAIALGLSGTAAAHAQATTPSCADTIRQSDPRVTPVPSEAQVREWMTRDYPNLLDGASKAAGLAVGFVIDDQCRVLRHTVGFLPARRGSSLDVVRSLFPDLQLQGEPVGIGAISPTTQAIGDGTAEARLSYVWLQARPTRWRASPSR